MGLELLPAFIRENYEVHEWKHACAILRQDFPVEWSDVPSERPPHFVAVAVSDLSMT